MSQAQQYWTDNIMYACHHNHEIHHLPWTSTNTSSFPTAAQRHQTEHTIPCAPPAQHSTAQHSTDLGAASLPAAGNGPTRLAAPRAELTSTTTPTAIATSNKQKKPQPNKTTTTQNNPQKKQKQKPNKKKSQNRKNWKIHKPYESE